MGNDTDADAAPSEARIDFDGEAMHPSWSPMEYAAEQEALPPGRDPPDSGRFRNRWFCEAQYAYRCEVSSALFLRCASRLEFLAPCL